jgi:hypothetical protein
VVCIITIVPERVKHGVYSKEKQTFDQKNLISFHLGDPDMDIYKNGS